jgi:hypothetical protein
MDERQRLSNDLRRYWAIREAIWDKQAVMAIDQLIREASDRLARLQNGRSDTLKLPAAIR